MNQTNAGSHRADEIYRRGSETLIAQSTTILAGPISNYSQNVQLRSEGGADSIPLRWVVSGVIDKPQTLKGQAPSGAVRFSRAEQSIVLPKDPSTADWESVYGELTLDGQVVIFFGDTSPESILKVLPSGAGEENLIGLVKEIVQAQAIADQSERVKRWLLSIKSCVSDECRKAALRSFIADRGEWPQLVPILEQALSNSQLSREFRAFGFNIVVYNVIQEKWGDSRDAVLAFLCRVFSNELDPRLAIQYVYSLGLIFKFCDDEDFRSQRRSMRQRLESCFEQRRSLAANDNSAGNRNLEEQYQTLRAKYLQH